MPLGGPATSSLQLACPSSSVSPILAGMGVSRTIVDPKTETDIIVREVPNERASGGVSRRLVTWIFETPEGRYLCGVPMYRSVSLASVPDHELEEVYLLGLRYR